LGTSKPTNQTGKGKEKNRIGVKKNKLGGGARTEGVEKNGGD